MILLFRVAMELLLVSQETPEPDVADMCVLYELISVSWKTC